MRRLWGVQAASRKEHPFASSGPELPIPAAEMAKEGYTLGITVGKRVWSENWAHPSTRHLHLNMITKILNQEAEWWR